MNKQTKICVIGLGYVGLPLARLFSTKYQTIGFDLNKSRVEELSNGHDSTLEVSDELLFEAINKHGFKCTSNLEDIKDCNFYIVAVPTPVDSNNRPDLNPLWGASKTVGQVISKGDIVVYESTVYPGVTEEECLPVIENVSGLKFNKDFYAGYSPERINPGDKLHTVEQIKKVTFLSASSQKYLLFSLGFLCAFRPSRFRGGSNLKIRRKTRFASLSRYIHLRGNSSSKNAETQSTTGFHDHAF